MKKTFLRTALMAAAALSLTLTACGASKSTSNAFYKEDKMIAETAAAASYASAGAYAPTAQMAREEMAMDMEAPAEFGAAGAAMNAGSEASVTGGASNISEADAAALEQDAKNENFGKLIRTVNVSLQTQKYDALTESVRKRVSELGGYIESSNEYSGRNDKRSSYLVVRIPADKLDEFLDTALTEGTVVNRSENVEDITLTYSDVKTRVETLKVEQERLLELLGKAEDVESIIAIESRLSEISYEIENNASRLKIYDNKVSYSTVSIDIQEVDLTADTVEASLWDKIASGIEQNFIDVTAFFGGLLFALVINIPALIVLAVIIALIVLIVKKIRKRRAAKKAAKAAKAAKEADLSAANASGAAVQPAARTGAPAVPQPAVPAVHQTEEAQDLSANENGAQSVSDSEQK